MPFVEPLKDNDSTWLFITMASTLAGNFTILEDNYHTGVQQQLMDVVLTPLTMEETFNSVFLTLSSR